MKRTNLKFYVGRSTMKLAAVVLALAITRPAVPQEAVPVKSPVDPAKPEKGEKQPQPLPAPRHSEAQPTETALTPSAPSAEMPPVIHHVLVRSLGNAGLQRLLLDAQGMAIGPANGVGAPMSSHEADGARYRSGFSALSGPIGGTRFFEGGRPVPQGLSVPADVDETRAANDTLGSTPEGVVLEGIATGLGRVSQVVYNTRWNTFILDGDRAAYPVNLPRSILAELCMALAKTNIVGVSITTGPLIVYGDLPPSSGATVTLELLDCFLAGIVLTPPSSQALANSPRGVAISTEYSLSISDGILSSYRFANGFHPVNYTTTNHQPVCAWFTFDSDLGISENGDEVRPIRDTLKVRLVPLSEIAAAADGGGMADYDAIAAGLRFPDLQQNAGHLATNISYYAREPLVARALAMAQACAFFRAIKASGVDLAALAGQITPSSQTR